VIFEASVLPESVGVEPYVVEQDGSTDLSAWLPLADALELDLLGAARHGLRLVDDGGLRVS